MSDSNSASYEDECDRLEGQTEHPYEDDNNPGEDTPVMVGDGAPEGHGLQGEERLCSVDFGPGADSPPHVDYETSYDRISLYSSAPEHEDPWSPLNQRTQPLSEEPDQRPEDEAAEANGGDGEEHKGSSQ